MKVLSEQDLTEKSAASLNLKGDWDGKHFFLDYDTHSWEEETGIPWNPLWDFSQSFRLQVFHDMNVYQDEERTMSVAKVAEDVKEEVPWSNSKMESTMRAITILAARIHDLKLKGLL